MSSITESPPSAQLPAGAIHHLRAGGVSLVLDTRGPRLPRIVHWGSDLGELSAELLENLATADIQAAVTNVPDDPVLPGIVTEHATGWPGLPGLLGHRAGRSWSTLFTVTDVKVETVRDDRDNSDARATQRVTTCSRDDDAGLALTVSVELLPAGLLRARAQVSDLITHPEVTEKPFTVDCLTLAFTVPGRAAELLDFAGRHLRERAPQRHGFGIGSLVRDNRRGRTGADATTLLAAGTPGFDFGSGEVCALHTAWSGNHRSVAERTPNGHAVLAGGEQPPGEIALAAGGSYTSPWIYGSYGTVLDEVAGRFHAFLRARSAHPRTPRPVILNTWEFRLHRHEPGSTDRTRRVRRRGGCGAVRAGRRLVRRPAERRRGPRRLAGRP